jgi:hypothetical protein
MLTGCSWVYTGEQSAGAGYHEIDILENVNQATANVHSFYTGEKCTVNIVKGNSVPEKTNDCHYIRDVEGKGCSFTADEGTFGNGFNQNRYKVVAMQLESDVIKIWHFKEGQVPSDIRSANPDPSKWANPTVHLTPKSCDFKKAFSKMYNVGF